MTKEYIIEHGKFLARGTTRELYLMDGKVYKIAYEPENCINNELEYKRYQMIPDELKKYVPSFSLMEEGKYEILEAEKVESLEQWVLRKGIMSLTGFLEACREEICIQQLCEDLNLEMELSDELIEFLIEKGCSEEELVYPANYGVKDDTLILLDFADYSSTDLEEGNLEEMIIF